MYLNPTIIREATELKNLQTFLRSNNLPHSDVKNEGGVFFGYYDPEGNIIGSGGLEFYGTSALLRSVAVHNDHRGKSLGKQIVDDLIQHADAQKMYSIFLLTESAYDFFLKKGFTDIPRENVPSEVKSSSEFSFVCPASAHCMTYRTNVIQSQA